MRWHSSLLVAALMLSPAVAGAQGQSPIPDRWLTIDDLSSRLALTADQRTAVSDAYAALNTALLQAYNRREELRASYSGVRGVGQMSDAQRQALRDQLDAITNEYAGRQREVDNLLASIRAQLTAEQQAQFDALEKPRVLPVQQKAP